MAQLQNKIACPHLAELAGQLAAAAVILTDLQALLDPKLSAGDRPGIAKPILDARSSTVAWRGRRCVLGRTSFRLIERLSRRPGRMVTFDHLLRDVWDENCRGVVHGTQSCPASEGKTSGGRHGTAGRCNPPNTSWQSTVCTGRSVQAVETLLTRPYAHPSIPPAPK
jgi:hypothetical protein